MKAKVYVSLKKTVLDPQGKAIQAALAGLDFGDVAEVRQGKYFDISFADGIGPEQAREQIERIARDVLTNPVIEEFAYEL